MSSVSVPIHVSPIFRWMSVLAVVIIPVVIVPHVVRAQNWKAIVGPRVKTKEPKRWPFCRMSFGIFKGDSITWTFRTHEISCANAA